MLSLAIVWNNAIDFTDEIIKDMKESVNVYCSFKLALGEQYKNFVYNIYSGEEIQKIDKKYNSMISCQNKEVAVILFEFDSNNIIFNQFKKKYVYEDLDNLKYYIRTKYSKLVDNYVFDNIFHCTDDENECLCDLRTINGFLDAHTSINKEFYEKVFRK